MKKSDSDKVYTPETIAKIIINEFDLSGKVLDPCRGKGAFYDNLPETVSKEWCELDAGKDFFEYNEKVDWIISNPPYSVFTRWLEHSFEIADNIVYLIPLYMLTTSFNKIDSIINYGGIKEILIFSDVPSKNWHWPISWPVCAVYFKRNYTGLTKFKKLPKIIS